jgi:hypothetical protein
MQIDHKGISRIIGRRFVPYRFGERLGRDNLPGSCEQGREQPALQWCANEKRFGVEGDHNWTEYFELKRV